MEATIERKFIQALPADNPHIFDEEGQSPYIEVLKETFQHRPELLEAYLYGSWDALEGADQIIKAQWVRSAQGKTIVGFSRRPRLACDTAAYGDDEIVIMYGDTTDIEEQWVMAYCDPPVLTQKLSILSQQRKNCPVALETTGSDIGFACAQSLIAQGRKVIKYVPQGTARNSNIYCNLRAEAWSEAAIKFSQGQVQLQMKCLSEADKTTLVNQLCTPRYEFKRGKTIVEAKADIKKRLGRSPDRADCYIIFLWSYDQRVPSVDDTEWEDDTTMAESYACRSVL